MYKRLGTVMAGVAITLLLASCSSTFSQPMPGSGVVSDSRVMLSACIATVAAWSSSPISQISGVEVNEATENPSGKAWDFSGNYPGGTWRCGGPSSQANPGTVVVFPKAGKVQEILGAKPAAAAGSNETANASPEAVLAALVDKSKPPTASCLRAFKALAGTSYDSSEAVQNAAVELTVMKCATAGQYILAYRQYPAAWGETDASYIDGSNALITIRSACSQGSKALTCVDASKHGLL